MRKMKLVHKWVYSAVLSFGLVMPIHAANFDTNCLVAAANAIDGSTTSLGCTANDASISNVVVTWIGDGCVNSNDTAEVKMQITIAEPKAAAYNMGIFINTAGGATAVGTTADTTQCLHEALFPATEGTYDLSGGYGPFEDLQTKASDIGDICGDVSNKNGDVKRTIVEGTTTTEAIFTIACSDTNNNGYVDLNWATAWDEVAVDCTQISQTIAKGSPKCNAGIIDTNSIGSTPIGIPDLNVSIDCEVKAGTTDTLICTVNYINDSALGQGDYIDFHIDYNTTKADVNTSTYTTVNNSNDNATLDDPSNDDATGTIDWKVDDGIAIEPDDNGTLTFEIVYDLAKIGDEINISVTGYFQTPEMIIDGDAPTAQPLLYDEWVLDTSGGPTLPVTIAYVYPQKSGSTLDVAFSTATEVGNVGFNVYAIKGRKWIKLNDELIPGALDSFEPQDYQVSLDIPENLEFKKIGVAGVDVNGVEDRHGPFKIGHESGSKAEVVKVDWQKVNKQVKVDKKARKAAKKAARKATKVALKDQVINLGVSEDAVYRVTHDDLVDAGINLNGQKAKKIAISFRGEGVARYIDGLSKKSKWTEESFIEFMGTAPEGSDALYLDANQYQISLNKKLVVNSEYIEPPTVKKIVFEENNKYGNGIQSDDPFYDDYFYTLGMSEATFSRQFELPELEKEGTSGLTVHLSAASDASQHVAVLINGEEVSNVTAEGEKVWAITINVNNSIFIDGSNELTLNAFGKGDKQNVYAYDKLVISYDDGKPEPSMTPIVSLVDKVKQRSIRPQKGTDYIIISHPLFMNNALNGYIKQRESEGWNIQLVNVEDIYAAYGFGMITPDAIKSYLKVAQQRGITHVQLVGSASYDYHDYLGLGSVSFIPSIYAQTNIVKYAPSDTLYVSDESEIPQMAIGRWPVRTEEDLQNVVNKSLAWKTSGQSAAKTALFIADKESNELDFAKQLESIVRKFEQTAKWNDITRVYLDDVIEENGDDMRNAVLEMRDTVLSALNTGPSITSYNGHASPFKWSYDGLLKQSDIASIGNPEKPTMALPLACYSTYADSPSVNTMAHQMISAGENGAVSIYGAALFSSYIENGMMASKVVDGLFMGKTIGEAVLDAKVSMGIKYRDAILNGTLLGDVTLKLQ